jgi:hypothetical protein
MVEMTQKGLTTKVKSSSGTLAMLGAPSTGCLPTRPAPESTGEGARLRELQHGGNLCDGPIGLGQKLACDLEAHCAGDLPVSCPLRMQAPGQRAPVNGEEVRYARGGATRFEHLGLEHVVYRGHEVGIETGFQSLIAWVAHAGSPHRSRKRNHASPRDQRAKSRPLAQSEFCGWDPVPQLPHNVSAASASL